eukprot:TRINITY_DN5154_c0_g1_i1.p1 TRINITY_DN5154_c0_g1~~TRINITY_DN5154_c0_g1_i1.p1  ORF type:complete len:336 (+),score=46.79 TRINITY_DN5154_c0_g1_i1:234-1241(+)
MNRQYRKTDHAPVDLSGVVDPLVGGTLRIEHADWEVCVGVLACAEISTCKQLTTKISQQHTIPSDKCKQSIRDSFGDDLEVAQTSQRISLRCILTRTRIRVPARGASCNHLQCFDLENVLNANMWLRDVKCPLCNQPLDLGNLIVDGYMADIIQELADKRLELDEVDFGPDADWTNPSDKISAVELLSDNDDDDDNADPNPGDSRPPKPPPKPGQSLDCAIELSDSDDDLPIPAAPAMKRAKTEIAAEPTRPNLVIPHPGSTPIPVGPPELCLEGLLSNPEFFSNLDTSLPLGGGGVASGGHALLPQSANGQAPVGNSSANFISEELYNDLDMFR